MIIFGGDPGPVPAAQTVDGKPELASRDETNNTVVSQTVEDHPNIAHSAVPTPGIATTDRRRPCLK